MSNLSAIPQNALMGMLSKALNKGKEVLNYPGKLPESVPLLGGMGAGDLVFGQGPELMEDMSYGFGPTKGSGMATKVDPRTIDLAFAPGVATATATALRGGKAAASVVPKMATNEGRREFMKKAAGLGAGAAVASVTPDILVDALRTVPLTAKEVLPMAAKEVAPAVAAQVARAWTPELIKSGIGSATKYIVGESLDASPELSKQFLKKFKTPDQFDNYMRVFDYESGSIFGGLDDSARASLESRLESIDELFNYSKIERAIKTDRIPKSWAKQMPDGKAPTKDELMETMANYHQDPSGLVDQTRPDFFSRSFEHFYGIDEPSREIAKPLIQGIDY